MSCCFASCNFLLIVIAVFLYVSFKIYKRLFKIPKTPQLQNTWWGPGSEGEEDTTIHPFKINVPLDVLSDLKQRLNAARIPTPPLEGIQQQYGMNSNLLKKIVNFWKSEYDWIEREKYLNQYPQYKTKIQGLQMHFIRVQPKTEENVQIVPLLLLHGWPGSVREFYEIIPLLTTPQKGKNFVFEVVIPSLPGYGFSEGAAKPGLGAAQVGVIFNNLMKRLGHHKYYLQGGDWGSIIATNMAVLYPENILGLHLNMPASHTPIAILKDLLGSIYPPFIVKKEFQKRMYPLSTRLAALILESGYFHIQATKPDTVGIGLNDSPAGLAAYILEKFVTATNVDWKSREDGGLTLKFSYTNLLDNVMIYWITGSMTTAMRLYAESSGKAQAALKLQRIPVIVPTACAKFPNEIIYQPDCILKEKFVNLIQSTEFSRGGHFAAFEEPLLLSDDIWSAVEKMRSQTFA